MGGPFLVVGDVVTDIVCAPTGPWRVGSDTDASIAIRAGGSAANTAAWAANVAESHASQFPASQSHASESHRDRCPVVFVGRVGHDDAPWHRALLAESGVDARLVIDPEVATTRLVALIDGETGDRTMLTDRGAGTRLAPSDIDDALLTEASWVHLSGYLLFAPSPQATFRHIVDRCRALGTPWSVDPASAGYLGDLGRAEACRLLEGAAIGFPNAEEARWLAGMPGDGDVDEAACALTKLWTTVVLKLGPGGALVARDGAIVLRADAVSRDDVVDAVGAGDAFAGAWLATQLAGGAESTCLDVAIRTATAALGIVGGRPIRAT